MAIFFNRPNFVKMINKFIREIKASFGSLKRKAGKGKEKKERERELREMMYFFVWKFEKEKK